MPPRDSQLPEGTDHIINGAMETGAGSGASTGSSATGGTAGTTMSGTGGTTGGTGTGGSGGGSSSGFIGTGNNSANDDTGGTAARTSGSGGDATGSGGGAKEKIAGQVRDQVQSLKGQATDKARAYADQGKERATTALDNFSQVVQDAARSVDERLGNEYGQYAHRAADTVTQLADGLRGKSVDDLLEDSRALIRKSPGIAIGAAALIGFALARVVKAGMPAGDNDVNFTPDPQLTDQGSTTGTRGGTSRGSTTGGAGTTASGGV